MLLKLPNNIEFPLNFKVLAQNILSEEVVGELVEFYDERTDTHYTIDIPENLQSYIISEIPMNFVQTCLPPDAGYYLTYSQIKEWKSESERIEDLRADILENDYRLTCLELGL